MSATCTESAPFYLAGLALGSAASHLVIDGQTAHLRDADGTLERCP